MSIRSTSIAVHIIAIINVTHSYKMSKIWHKITNYLIIFL